MNPVVHFEMAVKDRKRASEFYTDTFGWKMKQYGEDMGNYIVAITTETDDNGMIQKPGAINGGFYMGAPEMPDTNPSVVIAVDDIRESMKKVQAAGGKVLGEPVDIPGVGAYVSIYDTEGNRVGMLQPVMDR